MINIATTPSIEVTIGHQTRQYHAFVTTAPAARRAVHGDALRRSAPGSRRLRRRSDGARRRSRADTLPAGPDRHHRAGLAASPLSDPSASHGPGRSRAGRAAHAAAVAVATAAATRSAGGAGVRAATQKRRRHSRESPSRKGPSSRSLSNPTLRCESWRYAHPLHGGAFDGAHPPTDFAVWLSAERRWEERDVLVAGRSACEAEALAPSLDRERTLPAAWPMSFSSVPTAADLPLRTLTRSSDGRRPTVRRPAEASHAISSHRSTSTNATHSGSTHQCPFCSPSTKPPSSSAPHDAASTR